VARRFWVADVQIHQGTPERQRATSLHVTDHPHSRRIKPQGQNPSVGSARRPATSRHIHYQTQYQTVTRKSLRTNKPPTNEEHTRDRSAYLYHRPELAIYGKAPATATPARQARGAKSFADFPTNETTLVQDLINLEDMGSSSRGKYAAGRSPARTYTLVLEDRRQNCHVEPFRQETKSPKWQHQGPSQSFVESSSAKTY